MQRRRSRDPETSESVLLSLALVILVIAVAATVAGLLHSLIPYFNAFALNAPPPKP